MANILLIEDEEHIAKGIRINLELAGHEVTVCDRGDDGLEFWKCNKVDLLILDLMLPGMNGEKILKNIREVDQKFPILILSAKDAVKSKVDCFALGTDDYLAKPFSLDEFLMRVERLLERASWSSSAATEKYEFGDNWINFKNLMALGAEGNEIKLTEQESKLLKYFIDNEGEAVSRKDILKLLGYNEETSTRTIDNFIVRFRKYFETNPKEPQHFISMRSIGYLFSKDKK
jgi:two-component system alkaline phosphatase synthesis response regulator PhoP